MNASGLAVPDWYPQLSLPTLLPDETLYSWGSRYHRRSGNALARTTALQLYGRKHGGTEHDLPSGIDALTLRTQGLLGSAEALISQRTLLAFYLPARPYDTQMAAMKVLQGDGLGGLKYRLGMPSGRFGAHHPLKACDQCLRADALRYGETYWRRAMQWPGIWVCTEHRKWITSAQVKLHGIQRFQWVLPESALFAPVPGEVPPDALFDLAAAIKCWCALPTGFAFDPLRLAATYRRACVDRGWVRGRSQNLADMRTDYAQWSSAMRAIPELSALVGNGIDPPLVRVLRRSNGATHPLRHLAAITWLYTDWASFWAAYNSEESCAQPKRAPVQGGPLALGQENRRIELIALLRDDGMTLRKAALAVGVAIATAQSWATAAGIVVARRPKILIPELRRKIVSHLRRGETQRATAAACAVKVALVRAVLRSEVGLRAQWHAKASRNRRVAARAAWAAVCKRHMGEPRNALRAKAPADLAWLYRNDRAWLVAHTPKVAKRDTNRQLHLDWNARDETLVMQLAKASADLRGLSGRPPIALWRLCQRMPELRPKMRNLNRLPKTQELLRQLRGMAPLVEVHPIELQTHTRR